MYKVLFVAKYGINALDDIYYYHDRDAAMYHFSLFEDDDSDLYRSITVSNDDTGEILAEHVFFD